MFYEEEECEIKRIRQKYVDKNTNATLIQKRIIIILSCICFVNVKVIFIVGTTQ